MHIDLTFEQIFTIGTVFFGIFILTNLLAWPKLIFVLLTKKKGEAPIKKESNEQLDSAEKIPEQLKHLFPDTVNNVSKFSQAKDKPKKGLDRGKILVRRILRVPQKLFIDPFNFKKFRKNLSRRITLPIIKKDISYASLWGSKILLISIISLGAALLIANKQLRTTYPQYKSIYPLEGETWDDYDRPIEIEFNVPIDVGSVVINRHPKTEGYWEYEKSFSFLPFVRRIKFYPTETIYPGEKVLFYINDLSNHFHTFDGGEHLVEYKSIDLPQIVATEPTNEAKDVPPDRELIIQLNQKDGVYVDWEFEFSDDVKYTVIRDHTEEVKVQFSEPLKQGEDYEVKVTQTPLSFNIATNEVLNRGETIELQTLKFTTVKAPFVSETSPEGSGVLSDGKIKVVFDDEMSQESVNGAFSTEPNIDGDISWEDSKTFLFTPKQALPKETHYEVKFAKGIRSLAGGMSEKEVKFSFDTIGAVKVAGWSPGYGAVGVARNSAIRVTFDQTVDHASAQSKFSISPNVSGSFSWSGNTMIYSISSNMSYDTKYTVTIGSPVKTVYGLDSRQSFSSFFTIESQVVILNVPQYAQTRAFSCNVVAAAMVLSFKGASSSEMGVYNGVAKDNTPCTKNSDGSIKTWGNPYSGFVGDINGGGSCGGYGVYWGPIASYIQGRGRGTKVYSGWSATGLAQEISHGNPAILWGQNGLASPYNKSWKTPGGQSIFAVNGMHSVVAVGYIGPVSNPSHIIVQDGWRGRMTLTVGQLYGSTWGYFNRTAVVVY